MESEKARVPMEYVIQYRVEHQTRLNPETRNMEIVSSFRVPAKFLEDLADARADATY